MPAIDRHSIEGSFSRVSAGTFLAASPMISRLRTKARFKVSSCRKSSSESPSTFFRRYSASSSMCCRTSLPKRDILHLVKDARPHVGAQALGREQLDSPLQQVFEEKDEVHKIVEAL